MRQLVLAMIPWLLGACPAKLGGSDPEVQRHSDGGTAGACEPGQGSGEVQQARGCILWGQTRVEYVSMGGVQKGGSADSPARVGDYGIVSFGASRGGRRIQWQVHERSVCAAGRLVCDAARARQSDIPELLPPR